MPISVGCVAGGMFAAATPSFPKLSLVVDDVGFTDDSLPADINTDSWGS